MTRTDDDEIEGYRRGLLVDTGNLDDEFRRHGHSHADIALKAAYAASRAAELKLDLKESLGEWVSQIREKLNEEGRGDGPKGRVTDKQVEAEMQSEPKVREAQRHIVVAESEARAWEALLKGSEQRGFQLSNLSNRSIAGLLAPMQAKSTRRVAKFLNGPSEEPYEEESGPGDRVRL